MRNLNSILGFVVLSFAIGGCAADDAAAQGGDEQDVTAAVKSSAIETFDGIDGQHYFHLVAANGEIVLHSEGYASADAAAAGSRSAIESGAASSAFEVRDAQDGESYFVLKAANGEIVGMSEMYAARQGAERGIEVVTSLVRELADKPPAPAKAGARFETFTGNDGLIYFSLRAGNGEAVLGSQGYQTAQGAKKGVASVRENGVSEARFEILEARGGQFYFRLRAANGEVIARSEMYASRSNATRARDTVMGLVRDAR